MVLLGLAAGLAKIFQVATDLREIKEVLQDIRRNTAEIHPAAALMSMPIAAAGGGAGGAPGPISPEDLVRAVHARGYDAIASEPLGSEPIRAEPIAATPESSVTPSE
jgi:hypothetical protein